MEDEIDEILEYAGYKDIAMVQLRNARAYILISIADDNIDVSHNIGTMLDKYALAMATQLEADELVNMLTPVEEEDDE